MGLKYWQEKTSDLLLLLLLLLCRKQSGFPSFLLANNQSIIANFFPKSFQAQPDFHYGNYYPKLY